MKKRIAILGSTGSIGQQALNVIRNHADLFEVEVLTAHSNYERLIQQAIEFRPNTVVITNKNHYSKIQEALSAYDIKVFLDISPDLQKKRLLARNGEEAYKKFESKWIPMELNYFHYY